MSAVAGKPAMLLPSSKVQVPAPRPGSWLAQRGGTGLRFSSIAPGLPPPGAVATEGRKKGRPRAGSIPTPRQQPQHPTAARSQTTPRDDGSDPLGDSLDDLLLHAQASLKYLEQLRRNNAPQQYRASEAQAEVPGDTRRSGVVGDRHLKAERMRAKHADGFWRPRCDPRLWTDDGAFDFENACSDSESTTSGSENEAKAPWDFLGGVSGRAHPGRASVRGPSASSDPQVFKAGPSGPSFAVPAASPKAHAPPAAPAAPPGPAEPGRSGGCRASGKSGVAASAARQPAPRKPTAPPEGRAEDPQPSGSLPRGHAAGFQFGTGAGATAAGGTGPSRCLEGPEREVAGMLAAAQVAGPEALKAVLKQLLLKWHPDKAPQGNDKNSAAIREEATRVLRFILNERERLAI